MRLRDRKFAERSGWLYVVGSDEYLHGSPKYGASVYLNSTGWECCVTWNNEPIFGSTHLVSLSAMEEAERIMKSRAETQEQLRMLEDFRNENWNPVDGKMETD